MSEVLVEYDTVLTADDGSRWVSQACGRRGRGTIWDGWIEFIPLDPAERPVRSRRETTQPSREALRYWATGLTPIYLKGALDRTLAGPPPRAVVRRADARFDGPEPEPGSADEAPMQGRRPVLDPFDVYAQGEDILSGQLDALDLQRLRDIVVFYEIAGVPLPQTATRSELISRILAAARAASTTHV
jgi:hypothetical protein